METTLDLTTILPLTAGALDLAASSVPGVLLSDQLGRLTNSLPLHVHDAVRTIEGDVVRVQGKAELLNLPDLPAVLEVKPTAGGLELTAVFTLRNLAAGAQLPLATLCQQLGVGNVPPLAMEELTLVSDYAGNFSLSATMAAAPGWTLDLGPVPLTISGVQLALTKPHGELASSFFSGTLALGDALSLAMTCDTAGAFGLEAPLPTVRLSQLISKFSNQALALPSGFDLTFTEGVVLIKRESAGLVFRFATAMASLGTAVFEAKRADGTWGFAAGISLGQSRLSGLPGLSALKAFEDVFKLQELLLVVASFADPSFSFPNLAAFDTPVLNTGSQQLPIQTGGLIKGVNIYAKWQLDATKKDQNLLRSLLRIDASLAVALQVGTQPSQDSRLYVSYATTIRGMPFNCKFGGQLSAGQVSLFLTGTLQASIQGKPVQFDAALLFVSNGAFLSGSMLGSVKMPFLHLQLSNLALAMGISWEGVPSLGIAATLSIDSFQSSLAVFFDGADPSKSMLAGSVSDLTLRDVVTAFAQATVPSELDQALAQVALVGTSDATISSSVATALDNRELTAIAAALVTVGIIVPATTSQVLLVIGQQGSKWFLTDLTTMLHYELVKQATGIRVRLNPQLYFAPQTTSIGALVFQQAFYLNAKLKIFAFEATVKIMIMPSTGIAIDGNMSPITIGNATLFSLQASSDATLGPRISLATFSQASPAATQPLVAAPAPVATPAPVPTPPPAPMPTSAPAAYKTAPPMQAPAYYPQTNAQMQGAAKSQAMAQATALAMARFQQAATGGSANGSTPPPAAPVLVVPVAPAQPQPQGQKPHFLLDGKVTILGMQRGISVGIDNTGATFALTGSVAPGMTADLHGHFGSQGDLGVSGSLNVGIGSIRLGNLGTVDLSTGVQGSLDLGANSTHIWANFQGSIQVAGQTLTLPSVSLDVSTPSLLGLPAKLIKLVETALRDFFLDATRWAQAVKEGFVKSMYNVGDVLVHEYNMLVEPAMIGGKWVSGSAQNIAKVLTNAGFVAVETAGILTQVGVGMPGVASCLKNAGFSINEVGSSLKVALRADNTALTEALRAAGYNLGEVSNYVNASVRMSVNEMVSLLKNAGYALQEVGTYLKNTYNLTAEGMTTALKSGQYVANQVGNVLKSVYGTSSDQAVRLLRNVGYSANDVGIALKSGYGATASGVSAALKGVGYSLDEVGTSTRKGFGLAAKETSSALRDAGYSVEETGNFVKNSFNTSAGELGSVLNSAGYAQDQVKVFFNNLGGSFADATKDFANKINPSNW